MASRDGRIARATRLAADDETRIRAEIARARRSAGLSQTELGKACGMSRTQVARTEAGSRPASLRDFARLGAAVGLDVRLRAYPAGEPIRDAGQLRVLARLRARLHPTLAWRTEVPLPIEGDLRAWDAVVRGDGWKMGIEVETVLDDLQALERRLGLKHRDGGVDRLLLVVADSHRNRRALRSATASFDNLDRDARKILSALRNGRDPGRDGLIVL